MIEFRVFHERQDTKVTKWCPALALWPGCKPARVQEHEFIEYGASKLGRYIGYSVEKRLGRGRGPRKRCWEIAAGGACRDRGA